MSEWKRKCHMPLPSILCVAARSRKRYECAVTVLCRAADGCVVGVAHVRSEYGDMSGSQWALSARTGGHGRPRMACKAVRLACALVAVRLFELSLRRISQHRPTQTLGSSCSVSKLCVCLVFH